MKKIFGILSALLIIVCFTNEAFAEVKQDNTVVFEYSFVIPTAVDNVVVVSSVEYVIASVISNKDIGGSIISSDSADPDDDNFVAISNSKVNYGLWLLSKRKVKRMIASNDNSVTNDKVGEIPSNVGKLSTTYTI